MVKEHIEVVVPSVVAIALLLWKFSRSSLGKSDKNFAYMQQNAPGAQQAYDQSHKSSVKPMTFKEKLELSWQFLYDITDTVLSKFSTADQDEALNIGRILLENGGHYEHVIDYGIKHNLGRSQNKGVIKEV